MAKTISNYNFFGYDVNEALFLSEKEEETLIGLFKGIEKEYQSGIDEFTQNIIISQIEVILNYSHIALRSLRISCQVIKSLTRNKSKY